VSKQSTTSGSRPKLHVFETTHRQAAWSELFYDLAFVVIVAQLAHHLAAHPDLHGLSIFCITFVPVWWAWVNEVYYATQFDSDEDRGKRFLGTVQLVSLVILAVAVGHGVEKHVALVGASYALVRTFQLIQIWRAGRYLKQARPLTRHYVRGHGIGIAIWWLSVMLPAGWQVFGFFLGLVVEVCTNIWNGNLNKQFPPHISHLPERFGLFTILVLGESFVGAVNGALEYAPSWQIYLHMALGVLIAVSVWWTYFDRLDIEAVENLTEMKTELPYYIWLFAHLPLSAAIAAIGVGIELNIFLDTNHNTTTFSGWILPGALVIYSLCEACICATAIGAGPPRLAMTKGVHIRLLAALLLISLPWLMSGSLALLVLMATIMWLVVGGDLVMEKNIRKHEAKSGTT